MLPSDLRTGAVKCSPTCLLLQRLGIIAGHIILWSTFISLFKCLNAPLLARFIFLY